MPASRPARRPAPLCASVQEWGGPLRPGALRRQGPGGVSGKRSGWGAPGRPLSGVVPLPLPWAGRCCRWARADGSAPCAAALLPPKQVAVAVMESMAVPEGESPAAQAASFAKALHDAWGVGDAACNNGVLLLLAVQDRQVGGLSRALLQLWWEGGNVYERGTARAGGQARWMLCPGTLFRPRHLDSAQQRLPLWNLTPSSPYSTPLPSLEESLLKGPPQTPIIPGLHLHRARRGSRAERR